MLNKVGIDFTKVSSENKILIATPNSSEKGKTTTLLGLISLFSADDGSNINYHYFSDDDARQEIRIGEKGWKERMLGYYNKLECKSGSDISVVVTIVAGESKIKIGISTQGDGGESIKMYLCEDDKKTEKYTNKLRREFQECSVIISACRTKGSSYDALWEICREPVNKIGINNLGYFEI